MEPSPPHSWFGQYRLSSRVATGGMAEVYAGRHISPEGEFGPMVAVKRLLPHLVKDSTIVRMFLNEARITSQIQHPNVVRIHELGQHEGEPFIAMELLDGRTWADLRTRAAEEGKRIPLGLALYILTEACRGLDAAHNAVDEEGKPLSLVHRDFTPDNIHVGFRGDVKVIDFGIAKTTSWGSGTEPGTLKGKFFYMSPEMILGQDVDHRADLFAAGVMLYEQMCGRRPFTGNSADEVVIRIAEGKLQPPSAFDPSVPRDLEAVCMTALNRNPNSRFPSLGTFVDAIEAVGGEARLANAGDVAEYMVQLFPEQSDPKRQTMRRARLVDPSIPNARMTPEGGVSVAGQAPQPLEGGDAPVSEVAPAPTAEAAATATAKPSASKLAPVAAKRPVSTASLVAAGAGLVLAVVLAATVLLRSDATAVQRLEAAKTARPSARGDVVLGLIEAADATDVQRAEAAQLLVAEGAWAAAATAAEAWLKRAPESLDATLLEARASLALRRGKRFEAAIKHATALAPSDPRVDHLSAEYYELQGDSPSALEAWTKAARKSPSDVHALSRQGYWLSQTDRLDDAAEVLQSALKKSYDAEVAAELGFVKYRKEQLGEALKLLQRAAKEKPELMIAHYYLATVLYQRGDVKGARAAYLEADQRAGADTRPLVALCELEAQQASGAELEDVKKRLQQRFPAEAATLISRCAVAPPQ